MESSAALDEDFDASSALVEVDPDEDMPSKRVNQQIIVNCIDWNVKRERFKEGGRGRAGRGAAELTRRTDTPQRASRSRPRAQS